MLRRSLLLALILCIPGAAKAQIEFGNSNLIFNAGWLSGTLAGSGESASGNIVSITYENVGAPGGSAGFFSVGYGEISADQIDSITSDTITRSVTTIPVYLGGKKYFGTSKLQFHVGVSFGIYFSTLTTSDKITGEDYSSWSTTGFGMGFPIGLTLTLGKTLFVNGEYVLNWTWSNEALKSDILNAVVVGLGFRWGT